MIYILASVLNQIVTLQGSWIIINYVRIVCNNRDIGIYWHLFLMQFFQNRCPLKRLRSFNIADFSLLYLQFSIFTHLMIMIAD